MTTPEPRSLHPDALPVRLWRDRTEPPAVTVRCGKGKGRGCDRLAMIYETPGSAVVVFYRHSPDRPAKVAPQAAGHFADRAKRLDADTGKMLLRGRKDESGTVVCLEDDIHWYDIVTVGCARHLGTRDISRAELMEWLRNARGDKSGRVRVALR